MAKDPTKFDPYYYFLGVSPNDGPMDHYRLLGLESFESNTEIIEMAADRQMGYLQRHESGDHIDAVTELLSEVSRARICLLNPEKKDAYDLELRTKLEPQKKSPPLPAQKRAPAVTEEIDDVVVLEERPSSSNLPPAPPAARDPRPSLQPQTLNAEVIGASALDNRGRSLLIAGVVTLGILFLLLVVGGILLAIGISSGGDDKVSADSRRSERDAKSEILKRRSIAQSPFTRPDPLSKPTPPISPADEPPQVEIAKIEPEAPIEGDDVRVWLKSDILPEFGIQYRKSTTSSWSTIVPPAPSTPSRVVMRPPTGRYGQADNDDAPAVVISSIPLNTLHLEFRAISSRGTYSDVTVKDIPVKPNTWKSWRETTAITHTQPVVRLAFSSNGEALLALAATPSTSSVALQNAVSQMTVWKTSDTSLVGDSNRLETLAAAVRDDQTVVEVCQTFKSNAAGATVHSAGFSTKRPTLAGVYNLYAIVDGEQIQLHNGSQPPQGIAFSPKADKVAIDVSGTVQIWNLPATADEPTNATPVARFSASATLAPAGSTASYRDSPIGLRAGVLEFSPDGELLCRRGSQVHVWRVADERLVGTYDVLATSLAFSSDSQLLAVASNEGIQFHRMSDRQLVRTLPIGGSRSPISRPTIRYGRVVSPPRKVIVGEVSDMCFDRKDEVLAVANSNRIYVVRATDGQVLQTLNAYSITSLDFRPTGGALVCSSSDRSMRVFASSTSSSKRFSAPAHEPGLYLLIDKLITNGEYGPALDAMKIDSILSASARYTLLRDYNYKIGEAIAAKKMNVVHTALADARESSLDSKLVERFRLIRTKLYDEHRKLVAQDLAIASAASGQEQLEANYIIYRDYPSELLSKEFVKEQETLQAKRKADALKSLDTATKLARSRKANLKFPARKEFQKVLDAKLFLPTEAARAESLMRSYGLAGS